MNSCLATALCYLYVMVALGFPGLEASLQSFLVGSVPVSGVVTVAPVSSGRGFPCNLSGYFCDTCGAFLCHVKGLCRVLALHLLSAAPWEEKCLLSCNARPVLIMLTAAVCSCEEHSDRGHGSPLKLFVTSLLI